MARKKKIAKKTEQLVPWTVWALIILVIAGIVFWLIFSSIGTYSYKNLEFTKERYGNIIMHHHSYLYKNLAGELIKYNLYLRVDPRDNDIPAEGAFIFSKQAIALGINTTGLQECEDSTIAISQLSSFLANNDLVIETGTPDAQQAAQYSLPVVNCTTHPHHITIMLQEGSESSVVAQSEQCFVLSAAKCEILPVVEKFIVESIVDARER
ncbi:hypothetical protein HYZ97_04660 [Candidatus Pacearchaeota archaeon]|nr:hypothetical protein [Candidatus Pacearchaeota archaeon]